MTPAGGWDFFVSYTKTDREWAEWIAWILEENHYRVLIQAGDIVPGANWIRDMDAGTRKADRTIAVLSDAYLKSEYGMAESLAAWALDPTGSDGPRSSGASRPGCTSSTESARPGSMMRTRANACGVSWVR
jgi:hypothetical protein